MLKDTEARKAYNRERYLRTREQALNYLALQHAKRILEILKEHENEPRPEYAVADYLKSHCKFKTNSVQ